MILATLGFVMAGVFSLYQFLILLLQTLKTFKWRNVKGEIISSKFIYESFGNGINDNGLILKILYTYKVEDIGYEASRRKFGINFHRNLPKSHLSKKIPFALRKGNKVKVYFNPKKPQDATLDKSIQPEIFLFLVGAIISFAISTYIYFILLPSSE